jgi:hypothetical protein
MGTTATLVYTATPINVTAAAITPVMAAVQLPVDILNVLGVLVTADATVAAVRTVVLRLVPLTAAAVTAQLDPGQGPGTGSPIDTLTITLAGTGYVAPPDVIITDTPDAHGVVNGKGAFANPILGVVGIIPGSLVGGGGYGVPPTVTFVGGLAPGGVPATGTATLLAGSVNAVLIATSGGPYESPPAIVFTGGGGAGAAATASLGLVGVTLLAPGKEYRAPVVNVRARFKGLFPDGSDQKAPFWNLLKPALERALTFPIVASTPVIA